MAWRKKISSDLAAAGVLKEEAELRVRHGVLKQPEGTLRVMFYLPSSDKLVTCSFSNPSSTRTPPHPPPQDRLYLN